MRIQYAYIIGIDFLHTKETFMLRHGIKLATFGLSLLLYFFKSDQYIRYDIATDKVDAGYPKPIIGNWQSLTFGK